MDTLEIVEDVQFCDKLSCLQCRHTGDRISSCFLRKFELKCCEWNYIRLDRIASGVLQGTVLGPLLFSLHNNDIMSDIESKSNRKAMNRNWSNQKANPAL